MASHREIGIGLLGFGTIGSGVVAALQTHGGLIEQRSHLRLVLRRVADVDLDRDRGVRVERSLLTRDASAVVRDPAVDVVVELIGGVTAARTLTGEALALGKPVVTANKALLAEHGEELFRLAEQHKTNVFFEASVGGGIPLIRSLREGLVSNRIRGIRGILNGTCNYILTRMEQDGLAFAAALKEAQAAGYAEADPGLDIDGHDTAHKAVILASLAYGFHVPMSAVRVEGIRGLDQQDMVYASDLGYRIKMLAVIRETGGEVEVRAHPALVARDHIMASVHGVNNAVMIDGDGVGEILCYGRGAGREPTASAVLGDVVDAGCDIAFSSRRRAPGLVLFAREGRLRDPGQARGRYYLRLSLPDRPGTFGRIGSVLGKWGISIASLLQQEQRRGAHVPVVIITHEAVEDHVSRALDEIAGMDMVGAPAVRLRIEDFGAEA
jgi:homoserine dehydrogenase